MVKLLLGYLPAEWRDTIFEKKRFRAKNIIFPQEQTLIFFTETGKWHGGFCDRMKGIVSLFHFCLCKNIRFKISYDFPYCLSEFLLPNEYDWIIKKGDISFHRQEAKLMNLIGDQSIKRLKNLKPKQQIHAFANRNLVLLLNSEYGTNYTWGELFKKLFKPVEKLQNEINKHLKIINGNYVCAVFRFQNLLGDFKEYNFKALLDNEKSILLEKCKQAVNDLQKRENCKILVTSDSESFLKELIGLKNVFAFPSKVVHIDNVAGESQDVYMKSFLDFFLLSEGVKIFCIGTKEMYPSEFPLYAAKVNDIPFERIIIE
ncbi:MAG: hypothetical protein FWD66_05520 [Paludibacter sp.]|nr:hypothetical protein [Paludibacter sp.]